MSRVIAIDGPAGAGKSSVSREVGRRTGFIHVDSGALYRIAALRCAMEGIDSSDTAAVAGFGAKLAADASLAGYEIRDGRVAWLVDGAEPGERIRTPEIGQSASRVAVVAEIREAVTSLLRSLARLGDIIVEGRDITTAVFPDTPARFYLTASPEVRAERRWREQTAKGVTVQTLEEVLSSISARDKNDSSRANAPLVKAEGVKEIDTSSLDFGQSVEAVLDALPEGWRR